MEKFEIFFGKIRVVLQKLIRKIFLEFRELLRRSSRNISQNVENFFEKYEKLFRKI